MEENKETKNIFDILNTQNNNKTLEKENFEKIVNKEMSFELLMYCYDNQLNSLYNELDENKKKEFDNDTRITNIIQELNQIPLKKILFFSKIKRFF